MLVNTISRMFYRNGLAYINPGICQGSEAAQSAEGIARQPGRIDPR